MTKVEIGLPGQAGADAVALPVAQPLGGDGAKIVDDKLGGRLRKLGESGDLRGECGEAVLLHLNGELDAPRLVAAGVGRRDQVDADALIVTSAPSSMPSSTLTLPSVTLTVHWPAPSMSKAYELFMPSVFDVSARDGSVSKNSCTLPVIYRSFSGSRREFMRRRRRGSDTIALR